MKDSVKSFFEASGTNWLFGICVTFYLHHITSNTIKLKSLFFLLNLFRLHKEISESFKSDNFWRGFFFTFKESFWKVTSKTTVEN